MSDRPFPWRTLLFVSVAINLLVVGAAIGALGAGVRLERQSPEAVVERLPGPRAFVEALPPETQEPVRTQLAQSWVDSRDVRRAAAEARRDAFAAASEEPYNAERVRAAFARMRAADQAAVGVFHDQMAEAFGRMTPAERRQALAALRRAPAAVRRSDSNSDPTALEDGQIPQGDGSEGQTLREQRRETIRERIRERRERRNGGAPRQ